MLLLSLLRACSPFSQWRDIVAAGQLRRSRQTSIEGCGNETAQLDLEQFFQNHFETPELAEESGHTQPSDASQLTALLVEIQHLSERLFPGPVSFEHTFDPEEPSIEYTVFDVTAPGNYADYRERIFKWHDEVDRIVPRGAGDFRLIVGSNS